MRNFLLAGLCAVSIMAAVPALAATAEAPATAPVDAGHARRVVLVQRYFKAVNLDKMMDVMMHSMMTMMTDQMRKSTPNFSDKDASNLNDAVVGGMGDFMPKYMASVVDMYADSFTEDELTQLDVFYESPTGQSIAQKMPELTPKVTAILTQMLPDIIEDMKARLCAKTECPKSGAPEPTT